MCRKIVLLLALFCLVSHPALAMECFHVLGVDDSGLCRTCQTFPDATELAAELGIGYNAAYKAISAHRAHRANIGAPASSDDNLPATFGDAANELRFQKRTKGALLRNYIPNDKQTNWELLDLF